MANLPKFTSPVNHYSHKVYETIFINICVSVSHLWTAEWILIKFGIELISTNSCQTNLTLICTAQLITLHESQTKLLVFEIYACIICCISEWTPTTSYEFHHIFSCKFCVKHNKTCTHDENKHFLFCVCFASYHIVLKWCVEVLFLHCL